MIIENIITQHAEEAAFLWHQRLAAIHRPDYSLRNLAKHNDRLAAHIDGLRIAGEAGWKISEGQLAGEKPGELFVAMVLALEAKHTQRIEMLLSLAEAAPPTQPGLISAFGWISTQFLQGTVKELLRSSSSFHRRVGITCCAMHRTDPGRALDLAIDDVEPALRARALRAVGELGRGDLLPVCEQHLMDEDIACSFWAGWSAVLLGNRDEAVEVLKTFSLAPNPLRERTLQLALKVMPLQDAHVLLKTLAQDTSNLRLLIQGSGVVGDPLYVPWLIKHMHEPHTACLAGEAFSFITGLNFSQLNFERPAPEGIDFGPTEDPNDDNIAMDLDEDLPWPDPDKIQAWWEINKLRFHAGLRYFIGEPVSVSHCQKILREGFQRQRIAAALYLSLLQPGKPLFNTSAPAWRQQRWLSKKVEAL